MKMKTKWKKEEELDGRSQKRNKKKNKRRGRWIWNEWKGTTTRNNNELKRTECMDAMKKKIEREKGWSKRKTNNHHNLAVSKIKPFSFYSWQS